MNLTFDPAWPWSLPGIGVPLFLGVAVALALLTLGAYWGVPGVAFRRIAVVLSLRLAALAATMLLVIRPSLSWEESDAKHATRLVFLVDRSESMSVTDEFGDSSRWSRACSLIASGPVQDVVRRLASEQKVDAVFLQGDASLSEFDASKEAKGPRTDMGLWLNEVRQRYVADGKTRAVLLFSDGIDNGDRFPVLEKASQFRGGSPIHTFMLGRGEDTRQLKDIAVGLVRVEPSPVPVKTKMTVRATVQAPGFENARVQVGVYVQPAGAEKAVLQGAKSSHLLKSAKDNELTLVVDAPEQPGEAKVVVKVEPLPGEANDANNEANTYVDVTREGVRILWVEGKRRLETAWAIRHALANDARFRVHYVETLDENAAEGPDPFEFDKRNYDVIVIGDVSAKRFSRGDNGVYDRVSALVQKKSGLLLLGGYDSLGNAGWPGSLLAPLLPVDLDRPGQIDVSTRLIPTTDGLSMPFLKVRPTDAETQKFWQKSVQPFDGFTPIGTIRRGGTVLATNERKEPLMATGRHGLGRVVVCGFDTTWKAWRGSREAVDAHARYWKQLILWLAQQEESSGQLFLALDRRQLSAGGGDRLSFAFGLRNKKGEPARNAQFTLKAVGPDKREYPLTFAPDGAQFRGFFASPDVPGEYQLVATGKGDDVDGTPIDDKKSARFLVVQGNREMARIAADHELLARIAQASGGKHRLADERELLSCLDEIRGLAREESRGRIRHWPDWRQTPASPAVRDQFSALWSSTALFWFVAFVGLICCEWGLRRLWGMV